MIAVKARKIVSVAGIVAALLTLGSGGAAAAHPTEAATAGRTYYGTYQKSDGCVYIRTTSGSYYILVGYREGGNGGLYKVGGGFIAYPGWRIQVNNGVARSQTGTTLCTTHGGATMTSTSIYSY
ncbi:hypothetical protein ACFVHB_37365 [Kitasatospora sp. NPDC127111]|uniref:hypothetical protein n=1 Tax=Kitasatospora sp. NPDC127111 TaxID=3345363 RepID=UPI003642C18C